MPTARWVLKQLTEDQKASRLTIAKEYMRCFDHGKKQNKKETNFLNSILTWDEMWVHYAEPETKAQSKQWKQDGSLPHKHFKLSPSAGKVMLIVFRDSH